MSGCIKYLFLEMDPELAALLASLDATTVTPPAAVAPIKKVATTNNNNNNYAMPPENPPLARAPVTELMSAEKLVEARKAIDSIDLTKSSKSIPCFIVYFILYFCL